MITNFMVYCVLLSVLGLFVLEVLGVFDRD